MSHHKDVVRIEPVTPAWAEALAAGDNVFATRFGVAVEPGWAGFAETITSLRNVAQLDSAPAWGLHLFIDADGALVGAGGWKDRPADGVAELGYAVAPARQGRGIATSAVRQLLEQARASGLRLVVAHTLAERSASTSVLVRCGFTKTADVIDPDEGAVWRWEHPVALSEPAAEA